MLFYPKSYESFFALIQFSIFSTYIYFNIYAFQLIEDKTDLRHKTVEQLKEKD